MPRTRRNESKKTLKTLTAIAGHSDPQVALRLLRVCGAFSKLVFSSRVVCPDAHVSELSSFDNDVRRTFSEITGLHPSANEWAQAQRSFKTAGLGLRSSARHAPGAYLASRTTTAEKCRELDPNYLWDADNPDAELRQTLSTFNDLLGTDPVTLPSCTSQKGLSKRLDQADLHAQLHGNIGTGQRAALLSELLPGASGFLTAIPSHSLGLVMKPAEFVTEVKTRLSMRQYPDDRHCPCCDAILDSFGRHAELCMAAGDHTACHNAARNIVGRFACNAGLSPTLEKAELLPPRPDDPASSNLRRPADVYVPSWDFGSPAAFDFAIVSPQRQDVLSQASQSSGAAAELYEDRKRSFLNTAAECSEQGVLLVPFVAESSGGWGTTGFTTLHKLAKASGQRWGKDVEASLSHLLERLSVAIRSAHARAVLRRAGGVDDLAEDPLDAAATALVATTA